MARVDGNDNGPELIYGLHAVREALRAGGRPLQRLLVLGTDRQFRDIVQLAREKRVPVHLEPRSAFDRLVPAGRHQGVVGVAAAKAYAEPGAILERAKAEGQVPLLVLLDGVEDPHNLGAILRTAEASGAQGLFIPERRAVGLTSVVAKASAGAVDYIPVGRVTNLTRLIERLQAPTGRAINQNLLPCLNLPVVAQPLQCSDSRQWYGCCFLKGYTGWF